MKDLMFYFLSAATVCLMGCGPDLSHLPKTVKANGTVTLDGAPVSGATVSFIAEQGNYHATASTDSSGQFSLNAFTEKPGAVPGSYRIEVNKTLVTQTGGGNDNDSIGEVNVQYGLPKRYATMSTSGLQFTIPDQDTTDIKLELVSK